MKNKFTCAVFIALFCTSFSVKAQMEFDLFINDMLKVADDFASPAAEGAAYLAGAGWFSSAQSLDPWAIDLSVHTNILFVPENRKSASISNSSYDVLNISGAANAEVPTAFGGTTDMVFEGQLLGQDFEFDAIDGVNKTILAQPFVQASVGLPYGTDVIIRFLPETTIDDVAFTTYGIGLKHNFNQYFTNPQPTDFQFATLLAYSKYDVDYAFTPVVIDYELFGYSITAIEMQEIEVDADLWLLQFITSKSFRNSNWEVFGAAGAAYSNFNYVAGGGGELMPLMNSELDTLNNNEVEIKGDLGVNYTAGNFMISSMLSAGKFLNLNLGLHYRL